MTKSKNLRKKSLAVLAGIAIAGAVGASAATLGGLNSDNLGADTGDVSSCDTTGIDVDYTTAFDAASGEYVVTEINLSQVNANCNLQDYDITALDTGAAVIATLSGVLTLDGLVVPGTDTNTATISVPAASQFSAESLTGLAVSISGTGA